MTLSVRNKAEVNAKRDLELHTRMQVSSTVCSFGFISQQKGAPAHTAKLA